MQTSMNQNLRLAKERLEALGCSCVLRRGQTEMSSGKSGVAPLIGYVEAGTPLSGFAAADKIVGNYAAMLFTLLGGESVYGQVMSWGGLD